MARSTAPLSSGIYAAEHHDLLLRGSLDPALSASLIAQWDFSQAMHGTRVLDVGPFGYHGQLVQLPARAAKGWNWTGEEHNWSRKPEHYGAIHFHSYDIYDAGWETAVALTIPQDLKSGPYALHVQCRQNDETATRENHVAFFVRPPASTSDPASDRPSHFSPRPVPISPTPITASTSPRGAERQMGRLLTFGHADLYMYQHPELGGSLYDTHADGPGVCYSSRLRPVLNFAPRYHSWLGGQGSAVYQYNADTHLFDWLAHQHVDYDVVTDEDLHEDGLGAIADYRVIITGTHPEYHSTRMWDAMKAWLDRSGRLMYMGGNGWYLRIAFHDELLVVAELRRAEDGIRTWFPERGE
jgi:N,N-dimethylformamidase